MNELKPCPFCGGAEISVWDKSRYDVCVRCDNCNSQTDWLATISDAITAWNTRPNNWISVEERLPENNTEVLISIDYGNGKQSVLMGYMRSQDVSWRGVVGQKLIGVTHWQPLPQPPKGE